MTANRGNSSYRPKNDAHTSRLTSLAGVMRGVVTPVLGGGNRHPKGWQSPSGLRLTPSWLSWENTVTGSTSDSWPSPNVDAIVMGHNKQGANSNE